MTNRYTQIFPMMPRLIAIIFLLGFIVGCGQQPLPPATPPPAIIHILNWDTYIDPALLDAFTAETGIAIAYHTYGNNDEAYTLLTTSGQSYDLVIISDLLVDRLIREQRLAVLNHERLTNLSHLDPALNRLAADPINRFCVPYLWGVLGFGYHQSAHNQPITSWNDAFDPAHTSRIVMLDDARYSLGLVLIALGYSPNTTDPAAIGAARDWLRARAGRITRFAADDGQAMLARGEAEIVIEWSGDILQVASTDADIRFEIPAEGSIFSADSMCIPFDARNQRGGGGFIDFILTAEHGAALANKTRYISPNRAAFSLLDADLQRLIRRYQALEREGRLFRLVDVDPRVREFYRAAWAEVRR
ncbi:MAG: spermidine/putrescine ABC transporter substrate-binding protein [Chloroflexus sp.]|nr:spermidine/putrescine ABC transporter substrate-binding protein [Chloroflexus sp.]